MQPYFLPYIGYFQLIRATDVFVLYDNIKYTKKGWINRNRFLRNGADAMFSLPLKKGSDFLEVVEREISESFDRAALLNQFGGAYSEAPFFRSTYELLEEILGQQTRNLFQFIYGSILKVCQYLEIQTKIVVSSTLDVDPSLKGQDRVIAICRELQGDIYINPPGGMSLYKKEDFSKEGIELKFIRPGNVVYKQFGGPHVPWLSIMDVLMFNSKEDVRDSLLVECELL